MWTPQSAWHAVMCSQKDLRNAIDLVICCYLFWSSGQILQNLGLAWFRFLNRATVKGCWPHPAQGSLILVKRLGNDCQDPDDHLGLQLDSFSESFLAALPLSCPTHPQSHRREAQNLGLALGGRLCFHK